MIRLRIRCVGWMALALWMVALSGRAALPEGLKAPLFKLPVTLGSAMENTPFVFNGQTLLALNYRDDTKVNTDAYKASMYLMIRDLSTGKEVARFGEGHSFVNAFVDGQALHIFATEGSDRDWFQSIYHFTSTDLKTWKRELAIAREDDERLFNCSVCRDDQGYLMAYESNLPVQFCFKFARSKDLATWELSPMNPILAAGPGEGCNNSDVDLFEWEGNTYFYYATGDQSTWGSVRMAMYIGSMRQFFESCFPDGTATASVTAKR